VRESLTAPGGKEIGSSRVFLKRTRYALSLIFIDLDGLKEINDRLGQAIGSQAIIATAKILTDAFRDSDIIARLGGDEFVVLAMDSDVHHSETLLQRVYEQSAQHNQQTNTPYQLSMSVGVAHSTPAQPYALEELLEQADARMYADKQAKHAAQVVGSSGAQG
jgi:diguanylate cyclase (GGDEF)-like protein